MDWKAMCQDCVCLAADEHGNWVCDELGKLCSEISISSCPEIPTMEEVLAKMKELISLDYYSIYQTSDGTKWIEFDGMIYDSEDDDYDGYDEDYENEAKWYRDVSIKGDMKLEEFIKDIALEKGDVSNIVCEFRWFINDITKAEAKKLFEEITAKRECLYFEHITMDTPCGQYWC